MVQIAKNIIWTNRNQAYEIEARERGAFLLLKMRGPKLKLDEVRELVEDLQEAIRNMARE